MKKLILFPILLSFSAFAADEIFNADDSRQIVAGVKDIEITKMLTETEQFQSCRKKYEYNKGDSEDKKSENLKAAQGCFQEKLKNNKDPKALEKLSESLNLQQYGLIKSKNSKDIQVYLNNKMYQAMTGVNPDEADKQKLMESLKFKNKKHIDQGLFIRLYKTQLSKNSLFEVSRFCFENLRMKRPDDEQVAPNNFGEYWKDFDGKLDKFELNDAGDPKFGDLSNGGTGSDTSKIYTEIANSINSKNMAPDLLGKFFEECGKMISVLCQDFKDKAVKNLTENKTQSQTEVGPSTTSGSNACLARNRLLEYKAAIVKADKVENQFAEMAASDKDDKLFKALMKGDAKIFGASADDVSLDNLTNYTSKDFLEGNLQADSNSVEKKCSEKPELPECEQFVDKTEELDKVKQKVELEMTLKRDVEMARVRELKSKDEAGLTQYLKDNGFFNILEDKDFSTLTPEQIAEKVGAEFEARKLATITKITDTLGKRQVKKDATPDEIKSAARNAANDTKEERSRMAQVVLFNNIITSQLTLSRVDAKGNKTEAGRNVNAWKKEAEDLKTAKIDEDLFSNLKTDGGKNGIDQNEQIGGVEFIDGLLGKTAK